MIARIQVRRDLSTEWTANNISNPIILALGEIGYETDTNRFKIGDGVNNWSQLNYELGQWNSDSSGNLSYGSRADEGDVIVESNLVVEGNLTVNGTTTTVNTEELLIEDNMILLNTNLTDDNSAPPDTLQSGIEVNLGGTNRKFYWDQQLGQWILDADVNVLGDIYSNSTLMWQINGSDIYYNQGSVGIGTDSPATLLHLKDLTPASDNVCLRLENSDQVWDLCNRGFDDDKFTIYDVTADNVPVKIEKSSPTNSFYIKSDGNVGIGTSEPDANIAVCQPGSVADGRGGQINFNGPWSGTTTTSFAYIKGYKENGTSGQNGGKLALGTRLNAGNLTERMTIDSSGKVGIGTSEPSAKLTVNKGTDIGFIVQDNTTDNHRLHMMTSASDNGYYIGYASGQSEGYKLNSSGDSYFLGGDIGIGTNFPQTILHLKDTTPASDNVCLRMENDAQIWDLCNRGFDDDKFTIYDVTADNVPFKIEKSSPTNSFYIKSDGNVGIGETNPSSKLDIGLTSSFNKISGKYIDYRGVGNGTNDGYLLLIPAHTTGTISVKSFVGSILANRGSTANGNESMLAKINVSAAYTNNEGVLELFGNADHFFNKLSIVTFSGVDYIAAYFKQTGGGPANGIFVEDAIVAGLDLNCLTMKLGSEVTVVDSDFGSIVSNISGNVGIGTTSPSYELEVDGKIHASDGIHIEDRRNDGDITPVNWPHRSISTFFTDDITGSPNTWDSGITVSGWDNSTYRVWQLFSNSNTTGGTGVGDLYFRSGVGSTWETLEKVWTDANLTKATTSTLGLVKLGSGIIQTTNPNTPTATASRTYSVQMLSNDQLVVNVPWTDSVGSSLWTESGSNIYYNTGNVGVGTNNPGAKMDIGIGSSNALGLRVTSSNDAAVTGDHISVAALRGDTSAYNLLNLTNAAGTKFIVQGDGNVGIGTPTPQRLLTLGDGTGSPHLLLYAAPAGNSRIEFGDTNDQDAGKIQYNHSTNHMNFSTAGVQDRMVLDDNGRVGINTSSPSTKLNIESNTAIGNETLLRLQRSSGFGNTGFNQYYNSASSPDPVLWGLNFGLEVSNDTNGKVGIKFESTSGTTTTSDKIVFRTANTDQVDIDDSGNLTATGTITSSSDITLKENIELISNPIEKVKELSGYTFNKKGEDVRLVGLIAQEVEKVLPEAVHENQEGLKSLAYGNLVALLVECVKKQDERIDQLEKTIEKLK